MASCSAAAGIYLQWQLFAFGDTKGMPHLYKENEDALGAVPSWGWVAMAVVGVAIRYLSAWLV